MKTLGLVLSFLMIFSGAAFSYRGGGTPINGGGTGIIAIPNAKTIGKGVDLGLYWVGPKTISVSVGFGFIDPLDLSFAYEQDEDAPGFSPVLHLRGKYRFVGSNSAANSWAFGLDAALNLAENADPATRFSIYLLNTFGSTLGEFTWGFGYTFEVENEFNFMVGLSKQIVSGSGQFGGLFLEMDYANFNTRYFPGSHLNENRGVGNVALRVHLFEGMARVTIGGFDVFDANRQLGIGTSFKLRF